VRVAGADKSVWPEPCGRFVAGRTILQRALYQNTSALPTCAIPFGVWIEISDAYPMGRAPLRLVHCCAMRADVGRYTRRPRVYAIPLTQVPVGPVLVLRARCGLALLLAYGPLPDTTCSPTIQCLMAHIGWTPPACFPRDMMLWLAKLWIPFQPVQPARQRLFQMTRYFRPRVG